MRVSSNVVFLGLTSLFTDVSSEMVNAILPIYLTFELRFSPLQFGLFDGLYHGVTAILRLAGGLIADRLQNHKSVAAIGYSLSVGCKLALLAAANAWLWAMGILFLDRLGKGIRTAPRDALISLSAARANLAEAFGLHRAFDTAGACLGPVLAFCVLGFAPGAFDAVFVVSFCAAVIGLSVLVVFVENRGGALDRITTGSAVSLRALASAVVPGHLRTSGFALLTTAVAVARFVAAVLFGALWSWQGPEWTVVFFVVALGTVIPLAALGLSRRSREPASEMV